jgi:hypothetical protein
VNAIERKTLSGLVPEVFDSCHRKQIDEMSSSFSIAKRDFEHSRGNLVAYMKG